MIKLHNFLSVSQKKRVGIEPALPSPQPVTLTTVALRRLVPYGDRVVLHFSQLEATCGNIVGW
jgi:hypothetical protein